MKKKSRASSRSSDYWVHWHWCWESSKISCPRFAGHAAGRKSRAFKPCPHVRRRRIGLPAALFIAAIKGLFAFLTRGVSAGLMSLCGGLLSTLIMGILWKKTKFTPVFIGVCGAFRAQPRTAARRAMDNRLPARWGIFPRSRCIRSSAASVPGFCCRFYSRCWRSCRF